MNTNKILASNKHYWDETADSWFGVASLPTLAMLAPTDDELHLFGDASNKKVLDIGCGSGHSLKYLGDKGANELWGLDMSTGQIANAKRYLKESGYEAHLFNVPMESDCGIPKNYFDIVYSIYAIGWTTDLDLTLSLIASYLKPGGTFIFSWDHPILRHMSTEDNKLIFTGNYFDEDWFSYEKEGCELNLCIRKLSTYINALAKAGFVIEQMIEETDSQTLTSEPKITNSHYSPHKAHQLPLSFIIKARKL